PGRLLREIPRAAQVHVEDPVPAPVRELQEGDEVRDAGDLYRGVDAAEGLHREVDSGLHILALADVTDNRLDLRAGFLDRRDSLGEHVALIVQHHNARALGRERQCRGAAYALRRAGDHDPIALESSAHVMSPPCPGPRGMTGQMSTTRSSSTTW